MPDAGFDGDGGGWFTDWFNGGAGGHPMWETFHVAQLIPWIDENLRTLPRRDGRAIAGLSQGGFGALSYAARHPDLFTSVASFSGGAATSTATRRRSRSRRRSSSSRRSELSGVDGSPTRSSATRATHGSNWQSHNPASLVTNLARHADRALERQRQPWPARPARHRRRRDRGDHLAATTLFDGYLDEVGIRHDLRDYGPGTHTFPYWARDLREYLPRLQQVFDEHRLPPRRVDFRATEDTWSQWGWRVRNTGGPGWTGLQDAGKRRFTFTGSSAVVATPGRYAPRRAYAVTWLRGSGPTRVRADREGRLVLTVTADRGLAQATVTLLRGAGGAA